MATDHRIEVSGIPVDVVRKDIKNLHLAVYPPHGRVRDLTYLESELPQDKHGVDVPALLAQVRREVREIPGFEVVDETALSTFSFAKYLMWKDLVDRTGQLQHNRVVNHLINNPDKPFQPGPDTPIPRPHEIDVRYTPEEMRFPLPADSSQLAAVMAANEGHDFVLIGPPGTGKSQTITNLIAQCLSSGKSVLFVAEKTAALDVVHRRLKEHGLGDCCLELHSNKAERKQFLSQMQRAWENRMAATKSDWLKTNRRLQIRRDQLNAYVAALHAQDASGWSVYPPPRSQRAGSSGTAENRPRLLSSAPLHPKRIAAQSTRSRWPSYADSHSPTVICSPNSTPRWPWPAPLASTDWRAVRGNGSRKQSPL